MKTLFIVTACLLAAGFAQTGAARAGTLEFTLQGTNPGGKSGYAGTVSLTEVSTGANGAKAGIITWHVDRAAAIKGIALTTSDSPGRLSISFPNRGVPGVALGAFQDDGSIRVIWYIGGEAAGTEVWKLKH